MRKKLIIFDLDDTLFPHTYSYKKILGELMSKKYGVLIEDVISAFDETKIYMDSIEKFDSIEKYYRQFNTKLLGDLKLGFGKKELEKFKIIIEDMKTEVERSPETYPDVKKVLTSLKNKGYSLAILTGSWNQQEIKNISDEVIATKIQRVDNVLINSNIKEFFDEIFITYVDKIFKPDKRAFERVLEYFDISPEEAVMIGDREEDLSASNVGITTILFDPKQKYTGNIEPDYRFRKYLELEDIIDLL